MIRHTLRVPWAGAAVALALLYTVQLSRPAAAMAEPPAVTVPAAATGVLCIQESIDFAQAAGEWYDAWVNYEWTLPGGTEAEILRAADQLDQATLKVLDKGARLTICMIKYLE